MGINMNANQLVSLFSLVLAPLFLRGEEQAPLSPNKCLERLMAGNSRYIEDRLEHPDISQERREAVKCKQTPFAIILGCSDSRVAPEILFDQGIGDLFVVRVAGNVVSRVELDSIDYAALYLHSALIVVLGHERCGAVDAVLNKNIKDIETVAALIEPAVAPYRGEKDALPKAVEANVAQVVSQLKESPIISRLIKEKKMAVVGAYYHLTDGRVELL